DLCHHLLIRKNRPRKPNWLHHYKLFSKLKLNRSDPLPKPCKRPSRYIVVLPCSHREPLLRPVIPKRLRLCNSISQCFDSEAAQSLSPKLGFSPPNRHGGSAPLPGDLQLT